MKWIDACINNKLLIFGAAVLLCILGAMSLLVMPVAPFPSVQVNAIDIQVSYAGANADTIQQQVVDKIVSGLQSINNVQQITANAQSGSANIELTLDDDLTPMQMLQTQMQVNQAVASSNLPSVVPQPIVQQEQGQSTLVYYVAYSNKTPLFNLQNFVQGVMVPMFNTFPQVFVRSDDNGAVIKVALDPIKMAANQLDPITVATLLNNTYQSTPLGNLNIQGQTYILNMPNTLSTLQQLGNIVVGYHYADPLSLQSPLVGQAIYLKDIANIQFEPRDQTPNFFFSVNGEPAAEVQLSTHTNANPFTITQKADAYVQSLKASLPSDVHILKLFDMSSIMKSSMLEVALTIVISSILVVLIVLVFLGRWRTTAIPIITIPICLLGAMIFMYLSGFTLNIISLLAMVIAVGLVVDDAIVVVENISRHLEEGMPKHQAVLQGTKDIAITIIAITLTLVAVYVPILCSTNMVASLFKPFALTLAGAVFISGIAALTLTPVMSYRWLTDAPLTRYQHRFDDRLAKIIRGYHRCLAPILRWRKISLTVVVVMVLAGIYGVWRLPQTIFPNDPDMSVEVVVQGSPQDSVQSIQKKLEQFAPFYTNNPMLTVYMFYIERDPNSGLLTGQLQFGLKMKYLTRTDAWVAQINQFIQQHHISNTYAKAPNFSSWGMYDVSFFIYGSNINVLNQAAQSITAQLKTMPQLSFVTNQINPPQKQLVFDIDEPKAASLGILRQNIANELSTYYGGYTLNDYFSVDHLSVPIVMQLNNASLRDPQSLQSLLIQSPVTHQFYALSNFVSLQTVAKPMMITTFNGQPAVEIDANVAGGNSLGTVLPLISKLVQQHYPTLQLQYTGNALQYAQSNNQTLFILLIGLLCVYFLLTVLFKNLVDPFIIMLTVPFSMIGGALALYLIGGSINLYSSLGLITLIGLITKHGVLIVQFANQGLKRGLSVMDAVLEATRCRFRPIMMTTFAMVLGALPLLFSSGIMYKSRENLGMAIIGGLLIGTLFSLVVIPLVYVWIKKAEGVK